MPVRDNEPVMDIPHYRVRTSVIEPGGRHVVIREALLTQMEVGRAVDPGLGVEMLGRETAAAAAEDFRAWRRNPYAVPTPDRTSQSARTRTKKGASRPPSFLAQPSRWS